MTHFDNSPPPPTHTHILFCLLWKVISTKCIKIYVCLSQFFSRNLVTKPVEDDVGVKEEPRLAELSGPTQPEVTEDEERTGKHRVALGQ